MLSPDAQKIFDILTPEWMGTKDICLAAGMVYRGDGSANHNLAYKPLLELVGQGMAEKRKMPWRHGYTQYRRAGSGEAA